MQKNTCFLCHRMSTSYSVLLKVQGETCECHNFTEKNMSQILY